MTKPKPDIAPSARSWPPAQGEWTYEDYTRLPDNGFRYEVVDGALFMSPAPNPHYQTIAGEIFFGTEQYDRQTKYALYARAGVQEYWLVDPKICTIEVHVLRGQAYAPLGTFGPDETIQSELLPDLQLVINELCKEVKHE